MFWILDKSMYSCIWCIIVSRYQYPKLGGKNFKLWNTESANLKSLCYRPKITYIISIKIGFLFVLTCNAHCVHAHVYRRPGCTVGTLLIDVYMLCTENFRYRYWYWSFSVHNTYILVHIQLNRTVGMSGGGGQNRVFIFTNKKVVWEIWY